MRKRKLSLVALILALALSLSMAFSACDVATTPRHPTTIATTSSPSSTVTVPPLVNTGGYASTPTVAATATATPDPDFTEEGSCQSATNSNGGDFGFWGIPSSSVKPNAYGRDGYCILDLSVSTRKSGGAVNFDNPIATFAMLCRRPDGSQVFVLVDDYMDPVTLAPTPDVTVTRVVAIIGLDEDADALDPPLPMLRAIAGSASLASIYEFDGVRMYPSLEAAAKS